MAKVKLGLNGLALTDKIQLARQIVVKMTGNAAFTTPHPNLIALTSTADTAQSAYNDAQNAAVTAKQKTAVQDNSEGELDGILTQIAAYIESASDGDEVKILSAGVGVRSARTAPTTPSQVLALAATAGDNDGEIDLAWDPSDGAKSYSIDLSTVSGTGPWTNGRVVTRSTATVSGLTSGGRVWFRVSAIGAAGQGPWSDPATKIVP